MLHEHRGEAVKVSEGVVREGFLQEIPLPWNLEGWELARESGMGRG